MKTTYFLKKSDVKRKWYLLDAEGKTLGRLAVVAASILRGKHKPEFTPNVDTGDGVIIINAAKIRLSGKKAGQKVYRRYSGYPGGLTEVPFKNMLKDRPETVMKLAVTRMLPSGPLGRDIIKKLKIYADEKHIHQAQNPVVLEVK